MSPVLVDTDILSHFLRGNQNVAICVEEYLRTYHEINFSVITYYEVLNGLLFKDAKRQLARFEYFAELNNILPLTTKAASLAAEIYAELRK